MNITIIPCLGMPVYKIRSVKDLWSEKEQRLGYLLSKLKSKLKEGAYNYGFMMDMSIPGDVNVDSEFGLDDFESDNEGYFSMNIRFQILIQMQRGIR